MEDMRRLARLLVPLGIAVAVLGLSKIHAVRHEYDFTGSFRFSWAIAYMLLLWFGAYALGLPDLARRRNPWGPSLAASGIGAAGISIVQFVAGDALLPRSVVFGAAAVLVPWYVLCARLAAGGDERAEDRDRVIVVGGVDEGDLLRLELERDAEHPAQVVAALAVPEAAGRRVNDEPLVDMAITSQATVLVLTRAAQDEPWVVDQAAVLHESGIRVRSLAEFYEQWLGKFPLPELERVSLMFDISELHGRRYAQVKRLVDLVAGVIGFAALAVAVPVVAVANALGNRGHLFYRQSRVGRDGHVFTILKFRSMQDSEPTDTEWTQPDDARVTRFGRVLRRTHVDELPQVLNIVRGDLSIVGPRPEQTKYVEELREKIPFYDIRHLVRPGLTGWAQVRYGYAGDETDALEKLQYDFWYLRHQSLGVDLRIIARTIRDVFGRSGR